MEANVMTLKNYQDLKEAISKLHSDSAKYKVALNGGRRSAYMWNLGSVIVSEMNYIIVGIQIDMDTRNRYRLTRGAGAS